MQALEPLTRAAELDVDEYDETLGCLHRHTTIKRLGFGVHAVTRWRCEDCGLSSDEVDED